MPTPTLDSDIHRQIHDLSERGLTQRHIAKELGIGRGTVDKYLKKPLEADRIDTYAKFHKEQFEERFHRFKKWVGDTSKTAAPPKERKGRRKKALCLNDIHAPFHNEAALAKAIRDNRDADEVWIVGDLLDLFNFSRYDKVTRPFTPVQEFQSGLSIIKTLSETFPKIKVLHGNHDERFIRYLVRQNIPPDILDFFKLMCPEFHSPLSRICAGFSNVEMMETKQVDFAKYPFIHQIGDCVLSHAEKYSSITVKTTADTIDWLKSYAEPMGIVKDVKFVVQAHTHQAGKGWFKYGVVGIEGGCLAKTPDYAGDAKLRGGAKPPVIGYTVVFQEDGKTDVNASNFVQIA